MDLVYFILLVSVLVFIHELGHFATAKLFGVKVLVFSIGFGPKLLRFQGGETEYCLGLLPFGGFVTMLEEARLTSTIAPHDKRRAFEAQSLWKRVAIVLAGPATNVIFPVVLYTSVFLDDREQLPPTVGVVMPGKPADGQLMPGDRVTEIEGASVESFPQVQRIVGERSEQATRLTLLREGKSVSVVLTPRAEIADDDANELLGLATQVGRLGFVPSFPAAVIGVARPESPAYRAGLRTFDRVTAVNGRPVQRMLDLQLALSQNRGDSVVLAFMRPVPQPLAMGGLCDIAVMEPGVATLTPASAGGEPPLANTILRAADVLARTGIESSDLYASYVPDGSSEWKSGLRAGDRVTTLDAHAKLSWTDLQEDLKGGAGRMRTLAWIRDGEPMAGSFELRKESWSDEFGQGYQKYVFRTTHWVPTASDAMVKNPHLYAYAARRGVEETGRAIQTIVVSLMRVAQGRVSLGTVSGPITIYDVAGQAGAQGATYFVWAMALISVNLGLLNLLPVPVLDGGHLAFLLIEAVLRRPVSRRAREIASLLGMTVLIALMLVAFKNDVERHWGAIVGQWRELFRT